MVTTAILLQLDGRSTAVGLSFDIESHSQSNGSRMGV